MYNSNIERTGSQGDSGLIWSTGADLFGHYETDRDQLDLGYRPVYRYYVDQTDLSQLEHLTRLAWDHTGRRDSGGLTGSFSQTDDPRQTRDAGSAPSDTGQAPFVTQRTLTRSGGVDAYHEHRLRPAMTLRTSAYYRLTTYETPTLLDNESGGLTFGSDHRSSPRVAWNWGLDYQYFRTEGFDGLHSTAARAGLTANPVRPLVFDLEVNVILTGRGGFEDLTGADRLYGLATLTGTHDRFHWSLGYSRSFGTGNGLTDVTRSDQITAGAAWNLGSRDVLGLSAGKARSEGPASAATPFDLDSVDGTLSLDHTFNDRWALRFAVSHTRQTGTGTSGGVFEQDTVALGVVYGTGGGV